jgi:hypothetical protein
LDGNHGGQVVIGKWEKADCVWHTRQLARSRCKSWYRLATIGLRSTQCDSVALFDRVCFILLSVHDWCGDWDAYNDYNPINVAGASNSIGNATGNTAGAATGAAEVGKHLSYRGIENWYGHIWEFIDGINVNNNVPYVSNTDTQFADDIATNYTNLGITLSVSDGWQSTLAQISRGFLPLTVGANSTTKITDYYWQAAGWRVLLFGAGANNGAGGGGFAYAANYSSGSAYQYVGARVSF